MPKISISEKSSAALAPLTFCAAGLAAVDPAEAALTVLDVGVTLDAATATVSQSVSFALGLPGGLEFVFNHVGSNTGAAPVGAAFAVPGFSVSMAGFAAGVYNYAFNMPTGALVSAFSFITAAGTMAYGAGYPNEQFVAPGTGFVGFTFDQGGGAQFGWVEVVMNGTPHNAIELVRYVYGEVGDAPRAGVIPEPGSLTLLALGAAGVAAQRRRRRRES